MSDLDPQLERSLPHRKVPTPDLIRAWTAEERVARRHWFRRWLSSQVAGYRMELIAGYAGLVFFGETAIVAGIPLFQVTTPDPYGWAVAAGVAILVGGIVAGIGAVRAGEEPQTRVIRVFNWIELVGAGLLFLVLGVYAASLLIYGYQYAEAGRQTIGAAMTALAVHPMIRMVWLIFRPARVRGVASKKGAQGG